MSENPLQLTMVVPSTELSQQDDVLDSPTDWVAGHVRTYVETDGREGHLYQGWPTLLLTTHGRKLGMPRRTALIYGLGRHRSFALRQLPSSKPAGTFH